jgi:hypothetical protein
MDGLNKGYLSYLDGLMNLSLEKRAETYEFLREVHGNNKLALEQIDTYDSQSPYCKHFEFYVQAIKSNDKKIIKRERAWFDKHYPLT